MPTSRRPDAPPQGLAELERRLRGIHEPAMLRARLQEWARQQPAHDLYCALRHAFHRSPEESAFDPMREALFELLREPAGQSALPESLRLEVYAHAMDAGDHELVTLLRPETVAREGTPERLPREIADIPLGRRRSLAKGFDPRLLEHLAHDPDPTVLSHLLHNPRTREQDVVRIACTRPGLACRLEVIAAHPRWSRRPEVRVALARNPYTPVALALQMLNGLAAPELREIHEDTTLHAEVRAGARERLRERPGPRRRPRGSA